MAAVRRLADYAFARSGDKGDTCNVGVLAKDDEAFEIVRRVVTPEAVKAHFKGMVKGPVEVHEMANINAVNVVLHDGLGGGATRTLRWDQTGKSMGNQLLRMEIENGQ